MLIEEHDPETMRALDAIKGLVVRKGLVLPSFGQPPSPRAEHGDETAEETADTC